MPSNLLRRSLRKKQTRLAFDPVETVGSTTTMSPARIRYENFSSQPKVFDLTSPERPDGETQNDAPSPSKKHVAAVDTPTRQSRNSKLPFKPLATPVGSSQTLEIPSDKRGYNESDSSDSDQVMISTLRSRRAPSSGVTSYRRSGIPISPDEGGPSRLPAVTPRFISTHRKRRKMGFDGAGSDSSAGSLPEEEEVGAKKPATSAKQNFNRATSDATSVNDEEESPLESPVRASVDRGRALLPKAELESQVKVDKRKTISTRSFISGGSSYYAPIMNKTPPAKAMGSNSKSTRRSNQRTTEIANAMTDDEDDLVILPMLQQAGSSSNRQKSIPALGKSNDLQHQLKGSQRQSRRAGRATSHNEGSDEDYLSDALRVTSVSNPKRKIPIKHVKPMQLDSDEESEDIIIRSSPRRRRLRHANVEEEEELIDDDDDGDDNYPIVSSPTKRRRTVIEGDSGTDELSSPLKRPRSGAESQPNLRQQTNGKQSKPNQNDPQPRRLTRQQQQKKSHRTEREKKLELLKRQRAGEKIVALTSSESDYDYQRRGIYDSDSEKEVLSTFDDEEEDDSVAEVQQTSRRPKRNQNDKVNDDDDDFVVDDDEDPLGVPDLGLHQIPLEFTHQAHKPLKDHFKDAVEWLVQNKLNPGFSREDAIYKQAFKKLDDEVHIYAKSIYSSAVWREGFTRALWARPIFYDEAIGPGDEHEGHVCDACGRSGHPATSKISFGGKAYHKDTLDEVDNDHDDLDDEEDDEDSDQTSLNSNGQVIPNKDESWYVGRFCKANAETAHALIHWKHSLNEWVLDNLKNEHHLTPQKLAEREEWKRKKRNDFANGVVDTWAETGQIKSLYRDFKGNLESARQGKGGRYGR